MTRRCGYRVRERAARRVRPAKEYGTGSDVARLGGKRRHAARRSRRGRARASSASTAPTLRSHGRSYRLVFEEGTSWQTLGLKGDEQVTIRGLHGDSSRTSGSSPRSSLPTAGSSGCRLICRIDTADELDYYRNGGILQYVLRHLAA